MSRLSRRAILFAGALMSLPLSAFSAGLGKLTVLSNLGEPLKAEIEVVAVEKGERDSLSARLAAVEAYLQANLPFPNGSWGLKVSLETRPNGTPFVYVRSVNPVSEPFVDVLVDLRWNGGRLLRAYTALLDPPAYTAPEMVAPATPAAPAEPVGSAAPASEPAMTEPSTAAVAPPVAPEPAATPQQPAAATAEPEMAEPAAAPQADASPASQPTPAPTASPSSGSTTRTIKRGDTLSKIAGEVKPNDVTLQQMLVLLYRTNPDAFVGNNMNRLRTGRILRLPEGSELSSVTAADAAKEVRVHTADWNAWREKIAGGVSSMPTVPETSQSASGSVTAKVEDKPAPSAEPPKEVLKLSKGESADGKPAGKGAVKDRAAALEEDLTASKKAVTEAEDRAAKLEKSIKDMQSAVELKSKEMAAAEQAAKDAKAAKEAQSLPKPADGAMPKPDAAPATAPEVTAEAAPVAPAPDAAPAAPAEPVAAAPATPVEPVANKPRKPIRVEETAPEPSLLTKILGEPLYLAGGAGVLALLGLGGFMAWRKRKADAGSEEVEEGADDDVPPSDETVSVEQEPIASSELVAKPAADDHVSEEVDPIAEADVYLAYGRDTQAEQILKEATQSQPQRQEVYAKLLEIYHKRKDVSAFGPIAQALHSVSSGNGEFWNKAARMGYQIDPSNPLYVDGAGAGPMDNDLTASNSLDSKLDLDLGLGQGDGTTNTDIDLGDMTLNSDNADLDLSALAGSVDSADLDLRTQVLGNTQQVDLSKTLEANERTQKISRNDLTAELSRTQEGKSAAKDGLDFDLDLSTITGAPSTAEASGLDLDVGDLSLGGKSEPTLGGGSTLPDVDLSSISLELDSTSPNGEGGNGSRDEHWHDVQTKFDLAKAYQEMGDKEGAREILREVVAEGDDDQKNAAQKVLEALA